MRITDRGYAVAVMVFLLVGFLTGLFGLYWGQA